MRALLITHGELGHALLESARRIYAVDAPVDVLSNDSRDLEGLVAEVRGWLQRDDGEALLLVDVGGGSCGVAARAAADGRPATWVVGGVNLPLLLTYLGNQGQLGGDELVAKMLDRAHNSIARLETGTAR